jgi:hypothetical protein
VITAREIFHYLNAYTSPADLLERANAIGNLLDAGLLCVDNDRDHIVALIATSAGQALLPPTLPPTMA